MDVCARETEGGLFYRWGIITARGFGFFQTMGEENLRLWYNENRICYTDSALCKPQLL
jgi:hypothetical protein